MQFATCAARHSYARIVRALIAVSLGVLCATRGAAEEAVKPRSWHVLDVWAQPHGLPQNTVFSILQSRDGYIWLGTRAGLA